MIVFQITIAIFLAAILGTALARKFHLPLELTLLVGSLACGLIPGVPAVHLDSEIIFFVFLPPILFAAAYFTSWSEFKRNIRPISFLAFGLVVFTVCGMAVVIKWLVPDADLADGVFVWSDHFAARCVGRRDRHAQGRLSASAADDSRRREPDQRRDGAGLLSLCTGGAGEREFHLVASIGQFFLVGVGGVVVGSGGRAL